MIILRIYSEVYLLMDARDIFKSWYGGQYVEVIL